MSEISNVVNEQDNSTDGKSALKTDVENNTNVSKSNSATGFLSLEEVIRKEQNFKYGSTFAQRFKNWRIRSQEKISKARYGYDSWDIYEFGFNYIQYVAKLFDKVNKANHDDNLDSIIETFNDYIEWKRYGKQQMTHILDENQNQNLDSSIEKAFLDKWEKLWEIVSKSVPSSVNDQIETSAGLYRKSGLLACLDRRQDGIDMWHIDNPVKTILNRASFLMDKFISISHTIPERYADETSSAQWKEKCTSFVHNMNILCEFLDQDNIISRSITVYSTSDEQDTLMRKCHESWTWFGKHINDFWD